MDPQFAAVGRKKICCATATRGVAIHDLALEVRRNKGMRMLQAGITQAEVARRLGVSRATVHLWNRRLQNSQDPASSFMRRGRASRLSADDCIRLRRLLERGGAPGDRSGDVRWNLASIAALIEAEFGVAYSRAQVSRIAQGIGWDVRNDRTMPVVRKKFRAGWQRSARSRLAKLAALLVVPGVTRDDPKGPD